MFSERIKKVIKEAPKIEESLQKELFKQARRGDEDAREDLICSLFRFIANIVKDYDPPYPFDHDDLFQEAIIGITGSIDNAKEDLRNPSIYFYNKINWTILSFIQKAQKEQSDYSIDREIYEDGPLYKDLIEDTTSHKGYEEFENDTDLRVLVSRLTPQEQKIIILFHGLFGIPPHTHAQIAKIVNLHQDSIFTKKQKATEKMKEKKYKTSNSDQNLIDLNELMREIKINTEL